MYEGDPTLITASLILIPKISLYSFSTSGFSKKCVTFFCVGDLHHLLSSGGFESNKNQALLSYSGIGYLGFILLGFEIGSFESLQASLIYMILYMVMSVCVFSVLLSLQLMRVIIMNVSSLSRYNFLITFSKG